MRIKGLPFPLVAAIIGVAGGSLILAWAFSNNPILNSNNTNIGHSEPSDASASRMPLDVKEVFGDREMGGDALAGSNYLEFDEEFVDDENHCEFCVALQYTPGPSGKAIFAFKEDQPLDLSEANKLIFSARGEDGGESLRIYAAGAKVNESSEMNRNSTGDGNGGIKGVKFALAEQLTLTKEWQRFEVNLADADLTEITHAFALEVLKGKGNEKQVVYVDSIFFTDNEFRNAVSLN